MYAIKVYSKKLSDLFDDSLSCSLSTRSRQVPDITFGLVKINEFTRTLLCC